MDASIRRLLETEQYESLDSLIEDVAVAACVWPDSVRDRIGNLKKKGSLRYDGFVRLIGYRDLPGRRWRWFPGGWNSSHLDVERKRTE